MERTIIETEKSTTGGGEERGEEGGYRSQINMKKRARRGISQSLVLAEECVSYNRNTKKARG